jgi:peptidoglycan-associated lipoprotein
MKKYIFYFIALFIICSRTAMLAQPVNKATPDALQKAAEEAENSNNPYAALEKYEQVYDDTKEKPIAAKIAKLNYDVRDYAAAEKGFSRLVLRDRKGEYTELQYWYAMSLKANGKYQEAIDMFNQYVATGTDEKLKTASKREIAGCELARKAKAPDNLLIANGGKKINSPQSEGSPFYSGGELYYASIKQKEVITLDGKEGDWFSKIYTSSLAGKEFADPTPLGTQINREGYHHGNVSITRDGKTMYFTRVELENMGITSSKIFVAQKGSDGWGAANEVNGVNGDYIAKHPCEGELFGEKVLFFVANIPGGKGGYDLYYAPKKSDGLFGLPVNLEALNTTEDEVSPFYRDGKLYFSSTGYPSFGGYDVFETAWNGSVWSAPKNMGMVINTSLDDMYYMQNADGQSGFVVSNRPGPNNLKSKTCCDDIYAWEIERVKVELEATTFRRKRKNEKENPALTECTVQVIDVTEKKPANVDEKTNAAANNFAFTLAPEKSYMVIATHPGYVPDTVSFTTVGIKKTTKVSKTLTLRLEKKPVEYDTLRQNEPIRLNKIYYDFDDDKILPESEPDLQFLVDLMNKYPDMKIELSSHTDAQGRDDYNEKLSQRRADSAKRWIVAKGIAADRIAQIGYGEKQILNRCTNGVECTDDEHRFNRRTEFKITAGPTVITTEKIEKREPVKPKGQNPGGKNSVNPVFFYGN